MISDGNVKLAGLYFPMNPSPCMEKFEYRLDEKGTIIGKRCSGYLQKVKGRYQIVVGNEDDSAVIAQLDELLSDFEGRLVILQVEGLPLPEMELDVFPAVGEDGLKVTIKRKHH